MLGAAFVAALSLGAARASSADPRPCTGPGCDAQSEEASLVQLARPRAAREPTFPQLPKVDGVSCPGDEPEECHLDETGEACKVQHMKFGQVYDVYPGGQTACLDSNQPYYFSVIRGNPTKLMLMFDDGGVCYVPPMVGVVCATTPYLAPWSGLLNRTDPRNPYRYYTILRVRYCSGDSHIGNTTQGWGPSNEYLARGAVNANAAVNWAVAQFPALQHLVLGGYSAGAVGVQHWAEAIIDRFGERKSLDIDVIVDSFANVAVPSEATDPTFGQFLNFFIYHNQGVCNNLALTETARQECALGTLRPTNYFRETMGRHRNVNFTMINTKRDSDQLKFGNWKNANPPPPIEEFYKELTLILKGHAEYPNFRSYLIDGDFHSFIRQDEVFTATPAGTAGGDGLKLVDWIRSFRNCPLNHHGAPGNVCVGREVTVTHEGEVPEPADYCDPVLLGDGAPDEAKSAAK